MMTRLVILICIAMATVDAQTPTHVCSTITNCKCQYEDDGTIVDISSLGNTDGTPRFLDVESEDGYLYSYNPCGAFEEGVCKGAAVCKKDRNTGETLLAGIADGVQFTYDELTGDTVVGYTAGSVGEIHTFVYLMCDKSGTQGPPQLFPNGTMQANLFLLTMFSVCACADQCDENGPIKKSSTAAIGVGTIVSIGIASIIILYFTIGALFMKFGRKASGKEIIPNSTFWCGLPGTVKTGFLFTFSKCLKSKNYDSM